uniref:DNA binding protein n=1 Tax=Rhizophora mucronata TaxID=61149 RepID=A0A2P2JA93_RHIMU
MNRSSLRESVAVGNGRNLPGLRQHLRGQSLTSFSNSKDAADENLDLFSKNRRTFSVASSDESSDGNIRTSYDVFGNCSSRNNNSNDDKKSCHFVLQWTRMPLAAISLAPLNWGGDLFFFLGALPAIFNVLFMLDYWIWCFGIFFYLEFPLHCNS